MRRSDNLQMSLHFFNFTSEQKRTLMKSLLIIGLLLLSHVGLAQSEPNNGLEESKPTYYALKDATIYLSPTEKITHGTILVKGDKIESIGKSGLLLIPKETVIINCKGKVILPAFIDLYSSVGVPKAVASKTLKKEGAFYWNQAIHPELDASEMYMYDEKASQPLIEKGFGFAFTHQMDGIARGEAAFVSLGTGSKSYLTSLTSSASYFSLKKGVSRQKYPSSQMGSIALLRQTLHDAKWYKSNQDELNISLAALNEQLNAPMFFSTSDKLEILRAQKIADEFEISFNYLGSGNEYEIIDQLSEFKPTVVLPLNYPAAYDVKNPYISRQIPLSDLKHWEMAPMNASILINNGVPVCISGHGTKSKDFWNNLRKSIEHGLTPIQALEALTMTPAKLIGVDNKLGSLAEGKLASFMIYDTDPLASDAKLLESWLLGERKVHKTLTTNTNIIGKYNISFDGTKYPIVIKESGEKLNGKLTYKKSNKKGIAVDTTVNLFVEYANNDITLQFNIRNDELKGSVTLRGKVISRMGVFEGEGLLPNGEWIQWTGIRSKKGNSKKKQSDPLIIGDTSIQAWYPNMAYGFESLPEAESIIIKNATLWTNEDEGILENSTVVVKEGKIIFVGSGNYPVPLGARVIDAKGKHVTSGIIDEHSHIAISKGVNEGGQAISAEVSIGDVVNPKDINIYRQLSGGVTASQLLHGSANPIGGQSGLIKLKWGFTAEDMLIDQAPKFIKFALGENVKQSNWGPGTRFPQTRMGVEQVYYDAFARAKAYSKDWNSYRIGLGEMPRKDLELEVLNEILVSERFVTCHSYVQSEINMLMHVADSMGFNINTFTHILEGYKVADKMIEHGVGGSTFSDWWAYKHEVNDAIPYNASIMAEQGIIVSINSDDAEMGRRLNQEAAKSVKYGGMSEENAWKMVTLNPAKLLHLDDQMGSLKIGKDADIVIWTDNPLSIMAKVEHTIIDGVVLYDIERDEIMRKANQVEKARIISKMLADNNNGGKKRPFFKKQEGHYHCDTIGEEKSTEENHH